jgi:hypothetical protein
MIITGRFIHDAPYFPANVVVGDWHGVVWLLADVGASHTAFLDRDLKILGVSSSALEIVDKRLFGIGGSVRTFLLRNIQMTFISDKGDFRLIRDIYAIQHDLERISPDEAELLYTLPSALGRDIINQFEFCCDYEAGTVSLKKRK